MRVEFLEQNSKQKFDFARQVARDIEMILQKIDELKIKKGDLKKLINKMQKNEEFDEKDEEFLEDLRLYFCIYLVYEFGLRIGSRDLDNEVKGVT